MDSTLRLMNPLVRARVREVSKVLFGANYRLEVAAAIAAQDAPFYLKRLVEITGIPHSAVHVELRHLLEVGMLKDVPTFSGERIRYLDRSESVFWTLVREYLDELTAEAPRP